MTTPRERLVNIGARIVRHGHSVFNDDLARLRTGHDPASIAVVNHMALNLLKQAKPIISLKNRRKRAG